ncbi:LOW QUALITY PROTEIN: Hypothetical protein PHPALM_7450 [Phytophthora palmivora]|uniref:Uncharacterized protein n=1 Tax=Phytophthora palmivora TaxID=4796 RepID=A0A2P4YC99_9STRA|nr:LOW QUALITY PROTEIN: Hypothetical protein PHPALM_7450 [Phytophthora palmivora]
MDMLYPLQLNDIHRVEQIINKKILGEKRKKQRDRLGEAETKCAEMTGGTIDAEMTSEMYAEKTVEVIDAEKRVGIDG